MLARAELESLLRTRKLDVTLSGFLQWPVPAEIPVLPTGLAALDARLGGGIPRGQLSEIAGPASSGRTSLLAAMLATTTHAGELTALVDPFDRFDPAEGLAGGIDLSRLLWVRGDPRGGPLGGRGAPHAVEKALTALNLVLQCGRFGLVALDLADMAPSVGRRLPFTTWMRLQRVIEGSRTACVLLVPEPLARSSAGLSLVSRRATSAGYWSGLHDRARLFRGLPFSLRIVRSRFRGAEEGEVAIGELAASALCATASLAEAERRRVNL